MHQRRLLLEAGLAAGFEDVTGVADLDGRGWGDRIEGVGRKGWGKKEAGSNNGD